MDLWVAFIGNGNSGKTAAIHDIFLPYEFSVELDHHSYYKKYLGSRYNFIPYEVSDQQRYDIMEHSEVIKKSIVVILVDVSNIQSYLLIPQYLRDLKEIGFNRPIYFIPTKQHLPRAVQREHFELLETFAPVLPSVFSLIPAIIEDLDRPYYTVNRAAFRHLRRRLLRSVFGGTVTKYVVENVINYLI